jgi:hypothetical protein
MHGDVDRRLLPRPSRRVRPGTADDLELLDALDRDVRGAGRGPDHAHMARGARLYVVADGAGRGYAYVRPDSEVWAVAADDEATATELLWQCLADSDELRIDHVTATQQWAVRVGVAARLPIRPGGCTFWRGRQPPAAYLPSGAFL